MTVWDSISKNYQKCWEERATLKEWLLPQFIKFIEHTSFDKKSVFDIGCGNGKYLVYLQNLGFKIAWIDSSPTAIEIIQNNIKNNENIYCADMYSKKIQPNEFDLIISIQTIHHWSKQEIIKLIDMIYTALLSKWKIFITLPNYESSNYRNTFKDKTEIFPGTFIPNSWPEKGLAYSFFTQEEIQQIFKKFKNITTQLDSGGRRIIIWEK